MKSLIPLAAIGLLALLPRPALADDAANALVKQAVTAEGGAAALRKLQRLSIMLEATEWEPEQSMVADGAPRGLGTSTANVAWDVAGGTMRSEVEHTMLYPFPGKEKYVDIVTPAMGALTYNDTPQRPMSGLRLAFELREMERASPLLLLKAMDAPQNVAALPDQMLGKTSHPAIAFTDGAAKFTILFDAKSHLPLAVRTAEDDDVHGDGHYDLVLGGWKSEGGAVIAHSLHYTFNGLDKLKVAYREVKADQTFAPEAFAISDAVKQAAKGAATGDLPWQVVLVRENFGRYDDMQAEKEQAEGPAMKIVEIAPNIQQASNRSHNSLIVAMKDYLVVFDAPANDAYARWVIDAAKQKYPGKPIRYLVLTHHHMDHIGGARTFVAEGATVIVGKPDKAHMERVFRAKHSMHPDTLQQHPKAARIVEVADRMAIKDGGAEIDVIRIANPHAEGMVIGYVLPEKLVYVTDLYSPGRDKAKTPNNTAFREIVGKLGIAPERYAGGHGSFGTQAEFDQIFAAK